MTGASAQLGQEMLPRVGQSSQDDDEDITSSSLRNSSVDESIVAHEGSLVAVKQAAHPDSPRFANFNPASSRVRLVATLRIPSSPLGSPRAEVGNALRVRPFMLPEDDDEDGEAVATAQVVQSWQQGHPHLVELDKETDLNVLPPEWLPCPNSPHDLAREHAMMTGALADLRLSAELAGLDHEAADFIASSSTMKTLFELPFSNASVTLAVHRVDQALILNGVINGETRLSSRFDFAHEEVVQDDNSEHSKDEGSKTGTRTGEGGGGKKKHKRTKEQKELFNKFMYYSVSGSDPAVAIMEKDVEDGLVRSVAEEVEGSGEQGRQDRKTSVSEGSSSEAARVFRRAVHFQFHHLGLLLGSDTVIFNRGARNPEISLRLEDADKEVTKLTCLDYWLDNIFNNLAETAVCYHKEGKVHGYQLVRTQDLPTWKGIGFEPEAVMHSASSVLQFLQTHCTKEAGTYWLYRPQGSEELQLFCLDDKDNRQRSVFAQPVGLLCFKIARRLQQQDEEAVRAGGVSKHRQRSARLFINALSVLDETMHASVVARCHEGLGDAMVGAGWLTPNTKAEDEGGFYVDENGDLQEISGQPEASGYEERGARPGVGDTASWGAAYSLAELENAMSHYHEAADVRARNVEEEEEEGTAREEEGVVRRLRTKAAKCGIAMAMRLLRRGALAHALWRAVQALDKVEQDEGGRSGREEQEVVSEALELFADVHTALAGKPAPEVAALQGELRGLQEEEAVLQSGFAAQGRGQVWEDREGGGVDGGVGSGGVWRKGKTATPLGQRLGGDVEENCNHAVRFLIRALQFCNVAGRRGDIVAKLAAAYEQLGAHYVGTGRFTRAHQHYRQGVQLFHSIGDALAAAGLAARLAHLFRSRADTQPTSPGLTAEQLQDLTKARELCKQAAVDLAKMSDMPAGGVSGEAKRVKALRELKRKVDEDMADIDMALAVGMVFSAGGGGGSRAGYHTHSGMWDGLEGPEELLQRAAAAYESAQSWKAAGAHVHLAAYMVGEEVAAAEACKGAVGKQERATAERAMRARRRLAERHVQRASELADGATEAVRVRCIRAELALRRGGLPLLQSALEALLQLSSEPAPARAAAEEAQGLGRWSAFDGGWGGQAHLRAGEECDGSEEERVWAAVERLVQALVREMVKGVVASKHAPLVERYKALYRAALALAQQHSRRRFLAELGKVHLQLAAGVGGGDREAEAEGAV